MCGIGIFFIQSLVTQRVVYEEVLKEDGWYFKSKHNNETQQNLQENTFAGVSFLIKLKAFQSATLFN